MSDRTRRVIPFPKSRRVIVDVGRVAAHRPTIRGLYEADLTEVLARLQASDLSLTAYVVVTLARAIAEHPDIQAMRDWRGRLVVFERVDVTASLEVTLEGRSFPLSHIIRGAESRTLSDITAELRTVKAAPATSPSLQHRAAARFYVAMPGLLRRMALRLLYRLPDRRRDVLGTAGVSAVGMFGRGGGWGIAFPVHSVDVLVGGIDSRPDPTAAPDRQFLALTLAFDHDVVDGAPATRFAARFREMLEQGAVLGNL